MKKRVQTVVLASSVALSSQFVSATETFDQVQQIVIDKLGVQKDEVTEDANFVNDLGADSLDTVELIMQFEEEFNIEIPDEAAENITTVKDAVKYIQSKK